MNAEMKNRERRLRREAKRQGLFLTSRGERYWLTDARTNTGMLSDANIDTVQAFLSASER